MSSELRKSQINVAAIQQACSSDKAASLVAPAPKRTRRSAEAKELDE